MIGIIITALPEPILPGNSKCRNKQEDEEQCYKSALSGKGVAHVVNKSIHDLSLVQQYHYRLSHAYGRAAAST